MQNLFCTKKSLTSRDFLYWEDVWNGRRGFMHRKIWDWCYIAQALRQHGSLVNGKKGLGFAVGKEPLVSAFANRGAEILATDLSTDEAAIAGWVETGQHTANDASLLRIPHLCDAETFASKVRFEVCNMNAIPDAYDGQFDFVWSSCALEHVGNLELAAQFIVNSLKCLRPGGIAVHTTEYNISSNEDTLTEGPTVLFRKKDIEAVMKMTADAGCYSEEMLWDYGDLPEDKFIDVPPYLHEPHLKLQIERYVVTTVGMSFVRES